MNEFIFISHRGNLFGKNIEKENSVSYIENAFLFDVDVEIDVWLIENAWYSGHDKPEFEINFEWLQKNDKKFWIHCKNIDSLIALQETNFNYFWHENDKATLTSKNYIWAFPSKKKIKKSIDVLPEKYAIVDPGCLGICSDYVIDFKNKLLNL